MMIGFNHVIQSTVDADVTVNVNGNTEGTFSSLSDINISITDGTDPVTPDAVIKTGNDLEIQVPAASAPVGATLMKTGQTTSYRTGDDGDLEKGRATSFTVLAANNPFGNTNRFTDELGGQTYTNNIVIDWSTYDGSTVLGYRRTFNGSNITWNNAVDSALSVSIGSFTTGWRLPNNLELINVAKYEAGGGYLLQYAPFNNANWVNIWSSTSRRDDTTYAYTMETSSGSLGSAQKIAAANYMPVRTFTVTGTTLS